MLSERRDGRRVTRQGRSASVGRAQRVDTPVGPQLRPYIAAGHRARRSVPTSESASVPRHPFVIAPPLSAEANSFKPTHTYFRRAGLLNADKLVREQYSALSRRISREAAALQTLQDRLSDAKGAAGRRRKLQRERNDAYERVFDAILSEEQALVDLYAPSSFNG